MAGLPLPLLALLCAALPAAAVTVPRVPTAVSASNALPRLAPPLDLSPSAGVYERRGVGLLAVDLRDSTALHASIGNRAAHALTAGALDLAEATARAFDGAVVRRMGDGYLMVFPEAHRAMAAAAAIQESLPAWRESRGAPGLELRAAVHAGRVLVDARGRSPEAYGQSVERALALADRSTGGRIAMEPKLQDQLLGEGWGLRADASVDAGVAFLRPRAAAEGALPPARELARGEFIEAATLFASLADWPSVFEKHGRRRAYATLKAFHALAAEVTDAEGGTVIKTSGDSLMASFPSAAAAVRAGLALQRRMGELRRASPLGRYALAKVGVSWGRVLRDEGPEGVDHFGNTVNAAARLMKRAQPGQLLVAGRALTGDAEAAALMEGAERSEAALKGFPQPIPLAAVTPRRSRPSEASVRRLRAVAEAAIAAVPPRE